MYIPLLIRIIGGIGYGNYYSAYNIYTFVYMVTIAGSSSAIPKLISEYSGTGHEKDAMASFKMGRNFLLMMGIVMTASLFLLSGPVVNFVGSPESYAAVLVLAPSILITAVSSAYRGYFQGRNNLVPLGISQFIEQVLNTVCSLIFSYIFMKHSLALGVAGGATGTAIGALASVIYLKIKYSKDIKSRGIVKSKPRVHSNKYIFTYIFKYSVPLLISALILYAGSNVFDQSLIHDGLISIGYSEAKATALYGDFGKYMQLINVPMIIISSLALSIFPMIAKENTNEDKTGLGIAVNKLFKIGFIIGLPSAIGLSVLSKPIYYLVLGGSQMQGSRIMLFGAYVFIFSSVYQLSNTVLNSLGKVTQGAITSFIGVAVRLICSYVFIRMASINIYGTIIGLLLSNIIIMLLNMKLIKNHTKSRESSLKTMIKPTIAGVIMGVAIYFANKVLQAAIGIVFAGYIGNAIALMITIYIGGIVYLQVITRIKGVGEEEMNLFPRKVKKLFFIR